MDTPSLINKALAWVLPHHCPLCIQPTSQYLCSACFKSLPYIRNGCAVCSLPLYTDDESLCGECQQHPPSFDKVTAAFIFASPIGHFVNQFKHKGRLDSLPLMVDALAQRASSEFATTSAPDLLMSVPLHWTTLMRRGFNQSEIIARMLAKQTKLPYCALAYKGRRTAKQQALSRRKRLNNLKLAFGLRSCVANKHIVLVDDVVTTGATAETLARLLKNNGARRVDVLALARTPKG